MATLEVTIGRQERHESRWNAVILFAGPFIGIAVAAVWWVRIPHTKLMPASMQPPVPIQATSAEVIGPRQNPRGDAGSSYTLVEFADYQCPPCIQTSQVVDDFITHHSGKVNFVFRNFPLRFHPYAMPAAITAETARMTGNFWMMHDALFKQAGNLDAKSLSTLITQAGIEKRRADALQETSRAAVQDDMNAADKLKVNGTPTFFLCCPNHRIFRLNSLNQVDEILNGKIKS